MSRLFLFISLFLSGTANAAFEANGVALGASEEAVFGCAEELRIAVVEPFRGRGRHRRFTQPSREAKLAVRFRRAAGAMATLEELTERIRRAAASGDGLGRTVKLDLKGEGVIHLDGASVTNDDRPADLTVSVSRADLVRLGKRELDPMRAVMTGRMKLSDMSLAFSLQPQIQALFERAV